LVSSIIALCVAGALLAILGWYIATEATSYQNMTDRSQQESFDTFQKEMVVEGFDPGIGLNPLDGLSPEVPAAAVIAISQPQGGSNDELIGAVREEPPTVIVVDDGDPDDPTPGDGNPAIVYVPTEDGTRGGGIGSQTIPRGDPIPPDAVQLRPPQILRSGFIERNTFPLQNLIQPSPINPEGTVYRYTLDASLPVEEWPVWEESLAYTAANLPYRITFCATHPSSEYAPSDYAEATYQTSISIQYGRANDSEWPSTNTSFTYADAVPQNGQSRGIRLKTDLPGVPASIVYTFAAHDPGPADARYSTAFMPALDTWSAGQLVLRARAIPTGPQYVGADVLVVTMTAVPTQLPPPTINIASNDTLSDGAPITAFNPSFRDQSDTHVVIPGYMDAVLLPFDPYELTIPTIPLP